MLIKKIIKTTILIFVISILNTSCFSKPPQENLNTVYAYSATDGFLVSNNNGSSWDSENDGLKQGLNPIKLFYSSKYLYITTFHSGIYRFNKETRSWKNINTKDFIKRSIYSKEKSYRKISGFSIDKINENNLIIATKHDIYRSSDKGDSWKKVNLRGLHKRNYITSVTIEKNKIFVGTSFNGIYELKGKRFRHAGKRLPGESYSGTLKFTEQISNLLIYQDRLYAGFYFGQNIYYKSLKSKIFSKHNSFKATETVNDIAIKNNKIYISSGEKIYINSLPNDILNKKIKEIKNDKNIKLILFPDQKDKNPAMSIVLKDKTKEKLNTAHNKNAIYVSIPAIKRNLNKYIRLTKTTEINAFVIDMKDDFGNIYYKSNNATVKKIRSQRKPVKIAKILKKLKANKIHSIARIVVFKDKKMFNAFNGKYAIKNKRTGKPWKGTNREFWVDPYSKFIHKYNIELAKELENLGFDEVQFDYIRFPSDGPINLCNFTYSTDKSTYKSEILIDFLSEAKKEIKIPISVDIYGFNSWYNFGNWIGQDIEELSFTVDAICPMVYPSHFGRTFYKKGDRAGRSYRIVYDGAKRALELIKKKVVIRPYLQAFNLLSPTWGTGYIMNQINASKKSGCSGYTLWNARGDYKTPEKALSKKMR